MKPNLPEPDELLKKLNKCTNWWRRFLASNEAEELDQIISELSPLDLATLDQRVRNSWCAYSHYNLNNWQNLRPAEVRRLADSKFASSLVGLASFHFNGRVREAAITELASLNSGKELPFLLIRLNDWVPQVREAAEKIVRARLTPEQAVHLLANISLVLRLRTCGRVAKKFLDDICDLLKCAECRNVLLNGTKSKDKTVRRISFHLAAEVEPSSRSAIIKAMMTDPDAVARSWAVRHFLPDVSPDDLAGVVEPMLTDRFLPVRRDALWFTATKRPDLARQPLRIALLDNHLSMREMARLFLNLAEVKSAAGFYIEAIQNGNSQQQFAAICGLGETGQAADLPLIRAFLNSPRPNIRRAAAYAIGRLDLEGQLQNLVGVLSDPSPSVSREAFKALRPKARCISIADLENLFTSEAMHHVRRNALTLIIHTGKWTKISALLKACADKDQRIVENAHQALRAWLSDYNSSFAEPTREDFQKILVALGQSESYLPSGFAVELRSCLRLYFK